MIIRQAKHKWYCDREGKECFMFIIQTDKTSYHVKNLWWWDWGTWKINTTEQHRILEV